MTHYLHYSTVHSDTILFLLNLPSLKPFPFLKKNILPPPPLPAILLNAKALLCLPSGASVLHKFKRECWMSFIGGWEWRCLLLLGLDKWQERERMLDLLAGWVSAPYLWKTASLHDQAFWLCLERLFTQVYTNFLSLGLVQRLLAKNVWLLYFLCFYGY